MPRYSCATRESALAEAGARFVIIMIVVVIASVVLGALSPLFAR
jgi:hypothetical protein